MFKVLEHYFLLLSRISSYKDPNRLFCLIYVDLHGCHKHWSVVTQTQSEYLLVFCNIRFKDSFLFGCNLSGTASSIPFFNYLSISLAVSAPNSAHSKSCDMPLSSALAALRKVKCPNKEAIILSSSRSKSSSAFFTSMMPS